MQSVKIEFPNPATADMAPFLLLRTLSAAQEYGDPVVEESSRSLSAVTPAVASLDPYLCVAIDAGSGWGSHPHWSAKTGHQPVSVSLANEASPEARFLRAVVVESGRSNRYVAIAPGDRRTFLLARNHTRLLVKIANPLVSAEEEEKDVGDATVRIVGLHPATASLVAAFFHALTTKLLESQIKYGYTDGWMSPHWMDECRQKLVEHVEKGDPRDVASYCAFLWYHGESTRQKLPTSPTLDQVDRVCLSFRHDFGLLPPAHQKELREVATEWLRAWNRERK